MKNTTCIITLLTLIYSIADAAEIPYLPLRGKTFFLTRSQSVKADRDVQNWHPNFPVTCEGKNNWWSLNITPEYAQSFRPDDIAEMLFGTPFLDITGSKVPDRRPNDILADFFGLGQTFISRVQLKPKLQNAMADFSFHIGRGRFYFHAHAPVVWAKSRIDLLECISDNGLDSPFDPLYMAPDALTPVVSSFCQAISCGAVYGEITEPLRFTKIGCPPAITKLSEIQVAVGYIFLERPNGWVSLNVRGSIPTGSRPTGEYLFEPIVGNGHHGELGMGLYSQGLLWEKDDDKQITIFVEMNLTHLFSDRQCRTFDLLNNCDACCLQAPPLNGFGSRYILTKEFDETGNYTEHTVPLANRTTLNADISIDIQMDLAIMFSFSFGNWAINLGYDAWLRSAERINLLCDIPCNRLGLKGIQNVSLLMGGPSNATQNKATLHGDPFALQAAVADPDPPVFINPCDININSGSSTFMFTNKIFSSMLYTFHRYEPCTYQPFVGAGFEVEFEGRRPKNLQPNKLALSQWGVWLKTGIGY